MTWRQSPDEIAMHAWADASSLDQDLVECPSAATGRQVRPREERWKPAKTLAFILNLWRRMCCRKQHEKMQRKRNLLKRSNLSNSRSSISRSRQLLRRRHQWHAPMQLSTKLCAQ